MSKRLLAIILTICIAAFIGGMGFAVINSLSSQLEFDNSGYVLQGTESEVKALHFSEGTSYKLFSDGMVRFRTSDMDKVDVPSENFAHYNDMSTMALSDGILLDFNDLTDNFINNYYISQGLAIRSSGNSYSVETASGPVSFGENLWKLSDSSYIIQSPELKVCFSATDRRETTDFVQVKVTEDGVVQILTKDNVWLTISEDCYIETQGGVRIYPVAQLIEDNNYKLSIAKLAVSADDSIVLSEAETRRQIVPEINIEAIDGEDGNAGNEGLAGVAGQGGADGEDGVAGEGGAGGDTGISGGTGIGGAGGADGGAGATGATGATGNDAFVESTTNTALPSMSFEAWDVSATALRGTIKVVDENGYFGTMSGDSDHSATVKIYEVETGREIACYQLALDEGYGDSATGKTEFDTIYEGAEQVYFATEVNALIPDTQYRISVNAFYKINETIYSREFLSRNFYTDSTGVYLSEQPSTASSVSAKVSVTSSVQESVSGASVYLLTPDQNLGFGLNSPYTYRYDIDYKSGTFKLYDADNNEVENAPTPTGSTYSKELTFPGLRSNSNYIARVVVKSGSNDILTRQALALRSLKAAPTWDETEVPRASYNRVTGGYEVYRPKVTDPDGGAVSYTYTVYSDNKVVDSRVLMPGESEPAVFFLESGKEYRFGVEMTFNDNEKDILYDLGVSDSLRADGASLPSVKLATELLEYNKFKGQLIVDLSNEVVDLTVDASNPLTLRIYADQILDKEISLTGAGAAEVETLDGYPFYSVSLDNLDISNQAIVELEFDNLYKNTSYTLTLSGALDLGDGRGTVSRHIGTVTFRTKETIATRAFMARKTGEGSAIATNVRIEANDHSAQSAERNSYALENLVQGQVQMQLLTGTGYGANLLATANIYSEDELKALYGSEGLLVDESMFGNPSLSPAANYTLRIASVADQTSNISELNYVNIFDNVADNSIPITPDPTPPELLTDPAKGIQETPILNKDAAYYGGVVNPALPDDAVVGFALEARYDNSQHLGVSVTYYAMEYLDFFNTVTGGASQSEHRLDDMTKLMEVTLSIDNTSDTVPKVAFLFDGDKDAEPVFINGWNRYYTGSADFSGNALQSGMSRGYRYAFADTVECNSTGSTGENSVYPYKHSDYADYLSTYGAGQENGKPLGKGNVYILNSGMCEAPKVDPKVYSYVYSVAEHNLTAKDAALNGTVTVHYRYEDSIDKTISEEAGKKTKITYTYNGNTISEDIGGEAVDRNWYSINLNYSTARNTKTLVSPVMNIQRYVIDYGHMLTILRQGTALASQDDNFYLCRVPVDWAWDKYFTHADIQNAIRVSMTPNLNENYIQFDLTEDAVGTLRSMLVDRAFYMKVNITDNSDASNTADFYLPISHSDLGGTTSVYARLSTGLLEQFYQKTIKADVSIFYDNGVQGWSLLDNADASKYLALQQTSDAYGSPGFSAYYVLTSNNYTATSTKPAAGLLTPNSNTENLLSKLRNIDASDEALNVPVSFDHWSLQGKDRSFTRYLRPVYGGIDVSSVSDVPSGSLATIKGVGEYKLSPAEGSPLSTNLTSITPTVEYNGYTPAKNFLQLNDFYLLASDSNVKVKVSLYEKETDAYNLSVNAIETLVFTPNATGLCDVTENDRFTGVEEYTSYYVVFHTDEHGILMDAEDASKTVYEVITSASVRITSTDGLVYSNETSYFEKELSLTFGMDRTYGISMSYDFYGSEEQAENPTTAPLLSLKQMEDAEMVQTPALNQINNILRINMSPAERRGVLAPGGTYYLRVTAYEKINDQDVESGYKVFSITIPPVGYPNALIRIDGVDKSSVTYQVTIGDEQLSIMGSNTSTGDTSLPYNGGTGLYMVRFTYFNDAGKEVRLVTGYDDFVYSINDLKKSFVLSEDVLVHKGGGDLTQVIKPDTTYYCHVYAVVDDLHNGLSRSTAADANSSADKKTWESFFKTLVPGTLPDGSSGMKAPQFSQFINSFWEEGNHLSKDSMDDIEARFHIGDKSQTTASDSGLLINEDKAGIRRNSPTTLRFILPESFGVVDGTTQAFKKIVWEVNGSTSSGTAIRHLGTSTYSNNDTLFQTAETGSYRFYYDIPYEIPSGDYHLVIQLFKTENELAPAFTFGYNVYD